jgi:hypothetical protein
VDIVGQSLFILSAACNGCWQLRFYLRPNFALTKRHLGSV